MHGVRAHTQIFQVLEVTVFGVLKRHPRYELLFCGANVVTPTPPSVRRVITSQHSTLDLTRTIIHQQQGHFFREFIQSPESSKRREEHSLDIIKTDFCIDGRLCIRLHDQIHSISNTVPLGENFLLE
jgi:hypothetical protein